MISSVNVICVSVREVCHLGNLPFILCSLHVVAFEGQNMKFTVNMLLTCILYCDAAPGCHGNPGG